MQMQEYIATPQTQYPALTYILHSISNILYHPLTSEIASERSSDLMQPNMSLNATWNCRNFRAYTIGFMPLFKPYSNINILYELNNRASYSVGFHDITMHRTRNGVKHTSKSATTMSRFFITLMFLRHWPVLGRFSANCEECCKLVTWRTDKSVVINTDKIHTCTEIKYSKPAERKHDTSPRHHTKLKASEGWKTSCNIFLTNGRYHKSICILQCNLAHTSHVFYHVCGKISHRVHVIVSLVAVASNLTPTLHIDT